MNATRIGELNKRMRAADLDALFVSNPKNVLYLSGFHTTMPGEVQAIGDPEGFVLVHRGAIHLLCDGRYIAGAGELPGVTAHRIDSPTSPKVVADAIRTVVGSGRLRIGYEADALLHCDAVGLLEHLSGMECVRAEAMVIGMRLIKSRNEIDCIRTAQEITGACFDHVAKKLRPGISEYETAFEIDTYLRKESEGNSFSPIVAFGETGARPHYSPDRNRQLQKGQMVLLDFGAVYHGYCGDMTRMAVLGRATDRHREVYDMVLQAQLRCLGGIRPGATCHELDALCRDYFFQRGCGDAFMHGTGHGVGLAIHEPPRLKQTFQDRVEPGMVFTVEPGLYFPGWGGVRIEDLVAITATGFENLTGTSKELLELSV